ncbi:iron-containing redox enzyme family protein [Rubripirellula sp.]|jgi:pyrroloquinoline-quinone synthase|nr:iron-containing redox enzyme family protein [Planctomycetaceae bacterium]MDA9858612.1 iron-containing redox enzyme family protein [Rubripirellula sp.]MDF1843578.1 iron-containing redox enzyme family protein [Rubripirellula sp.]
MVDQYSGDLKMEISTSVATDLMGHVESSLADSGLMKNRYFRRLQSGEMSLEDFLYSQQQFYFAVNYFSRPMAALLMRIPNGDERLGILDNIVEEHGNFRSDTFHEATFRQFLHSIGGSGERPDTETMGPAVHAFNATIMSACLSEDVRTGIACLGIIEYAFADISSLIGGTVVARDWLSGNELVHYKLHQEIDKQHAADFFKLVQPAWQTDQGRALISQGLRLGAYAFDCLYRDLTAC